MIERRAACFLILKQTRYEESKMRAYMEAGLTGPGVESLVWCLGLGVVGEVVVAILVLGIVKLIVRILN